MFSNVRHENVANTVRTCLEVVIRIVIVLLLIPSNAEATFDPSTGMQTFL